MRHSWRVEVTAFNDHYRLAERFGRFKIALPQTSTSGYFRLGENAICYGQTSSGTLRPDAGEDLYDILRDITADRPDAVLPFNPDQVIYNLRHERYMTSDAHRVSAMLFKLAKETYYFFRPLMPVRFRKHLQRIYLKDWKRISFPSWPVDRTVETIFEELMILSLRSHGVERIPFIWFWPDGYSACSIMTHDIETEAGRDFSIRLAELDGSFGIKSSFQVVPEERYRVSREFLDSLRARGCEVNLHGLNHDGQLFRDRKEFLRQVQKINRYAREYGAAGFRSPVMYRNLDWYGDFEFSYDMSVPNVASPEPQRGGCCTVMPYFIGNMLELPLTTTQDYILFNILNDRSIELWKRQIKLIIEKHGLVSFNIHPDYMISDSARGIYRQLLEYVAKVCAQQRIWMPLPGEVDQWWRSRREMRIVKEDGELRITGSNSNRAVIAYASLDRGKLVYDIPARQAEIVRSSA
jgi:hypothetical protein